MRQVFKKTPLRSNFLFLLSQSTGLMPMLYLHSVAATKGLLLKCGALRGWLLAKLPSNLSKPLCSQVFRCVLLHFFMPEVTAGEAKGSSVRVQSDWPHSGPLAHWRLSWAPQPSNAAPKDKGSAVYRSGHVRTGQMCISQKDPLPITNELSGRDRKQRPSLTYFHIYVTMLYFWSTLSS